MKLLKIQVFFHPHPNPPPSPLNYSGIFDKGEGIIGGDGAHWKKVKVQ
jgi:hypothetical protein